MTDELTRLKELAEKAKAADAAYTKNPETEWRHNLDLLDAQQKSEKAFRDAATPELILSLIARLEGAEEALKRARKVNESEDRMFEMFITKP